MNFTIKDYSGQEVVYGAMYGQNSDNQWCLYNFTANTFDVCVTGVTDAMTYMTTLPAGATGLTISDIPQISSGVFLFSYNQLPNDFAVVPDAFGNATVQPPSFLSGTTDYYTVFNTVEFTYTANTTTSIVPAVWVDITNVDYFSTPIEIHLTGSNPAGPYDERKGSMNSGRDSVFADYLIKTESTAFNNLAVIDDSGNNIRILGPQHGVASGLIPTNYWDSYVAAIWKLYSTDILTIDAGSYGIFTGNTTPGELMMVNTNGSGESFTFQEPSPNLATDIFGCAGTLAAPNNAVGAIARVIGAGINRSTILETSSQPCCVVPDFYQLTGSTNLYSEVLHKFYIDGTTYAFPFDDVCNGSSTLSCTTPEQCTITLNTFFDIC